MSPTRTLLLLIALAAAAPCQATLTFTDVALAGGLTWSPLDSGLMMPASASWLDYDNDGLDDLLCVGGSGFGNPVVLYRNLGGGNFSDVSLAAGLGLQFGSDYFMGSSCADYDNDGDTDIYITVNGIDRFLHNNGDGTFTERTVMAGLLSQRWGASAAWGDYDGDGFLDLFVANYIQQLNFPYHTPWANFLYRNNGDGTFTNVTSLTGVGGNGTTLAATFSDYDNDGDADLFVINDFGDTIEPNQLFRNDGPAAGPPGAWTFTEVSAAENFDSQIFGMGIARGDYDRNGTLDYYMSNLGRNLFLSNTPTGFQDVTNATQTAFEYAPQAPTLFISSWGCGFQDFDADGWLDLYVSNGYIPAASHIQNYPLSGNILFQHDGPALSYTEVGVAAGIDNPLIGRGCAFSDYDEDGDMDIVQANINGPPNLFRNDTVGGNWLKISPEGRISNRDGHLTRGTAEVAGVSLIRESNAHDSYLNSSTRDMHWGLGTAVSVDRLELRWPLGIVQTLHDIPANIALDLVEPLVTLPATATAPAQVQEGTTLTLNLALQNHDATLASTINLLEITVAGQTLRTPFVPIPVPANTTLPLPVSFAIPAGITQGTPFDVTFTWWVADGTGGLDQWRQTVTITP